MPKKRGFTLVELLVVIAIIALLMAMLMPALRQAQRQAKAVVCLSNLHQWGLLWSIYTNDNDGYFPNAFSPRFGSLRAAWWRSPGDYRKGEYDKKIMLCPMATIPLVTYEYAPEDTRLAFLARKEGEYSISYAPNGWMYHFIPENIGGVAGRNKPQYQWRHTNVRGADKIPVMVGSWTVDGWPMPTDEPPQYRGEFQHWYLQGEMKRFCIDRHNGYINGVLMDWSARKIGLKELWELWWHRNWKKDRAEAGTPVWPPWMENFKDYAID